LEDLDLDNPMTKRLYLAQWVKSNIVQKPGNFLKTLDLYNSYLEATPSRARVSQELFFKEIEPIMGAYNINPSRVRSKEGRGFIGIGLLDFIEEE